MSSSTGSSAAQSAVNTVSASSATDSSLAARPLVRSIPILMFHSILTEKGNAARIPPEDFAAEMKWLHTNGYATLTLDEFFADYSAGKGFPKKSVVLTFDDGYGDNYSTAWPVLKKYGFHATIFMISGKIGQPGYLTAKEIKEMSTAGIAFECHTVTHPSLAELSYTKQYAELANCKKALETLTGKPVRYVAYPNGSYDLETLRAAREIGFSVGLKMSGGNASAGIVALEEPRVYVGDSLSDFIQKVQSAL